MNLSFDWASEGGLKTPDKTEIHLWRSKFVNQPPSLLLGPWPASRHIALRTNVGTALYISMELSSDTLLWRKAIFKSLIGH